MKLVYAIEGLFCGLIIGIMAFIFAPFYLAKRCYISSKNPIALLNEEMR